MTQARLRAGTGVGRGADAYEAGRTAASAALEPLAGEPAAVVLAFATPQYDLAAMLWGIRSVTGDTLLVGSTASGEIVRGEYVPLGGGTPSSPAPSGSWPRTMRR